MNTPVKNKKVFDGRYEILGIVGRGRKSVVYHARNIIDGGPEVALKVLLSDKDSTSTRDKLRKEALAMVSCHHRYVVRLDDFHSVGDLSYLSMEFAPESDLRKFISKHGGKLSEAQAEKFLLQAARALDYIHSVGIIHRDIKPDNILVISEDEIRIGDFGIALLPGDEQIPDEYRNAVGTMDYMAPEVLEGRPCDSRTDLYALGLTAYEMVFGKILFESIPLANQLAAREDSQLPAINISDKRLAQAIRKLISYDSSDRFRSSKELVSFLTTPLEEPQKEESVTKSDSIPEQSSESVVTKEVEISTDKPAAKEVKTIEAKQVEITPEKKPEIAEIKEISESSVSKSSPDLIETQVISAKDADYLKSKEPRVALVKTGILSSITSIIPAPILVIAGVLLSIKLLTMLFVGQAEIDDSNQVINTESGIDIRAASRDGIIDLALLPSGSYRGILTGVHPAIENVPLYLISDLEHAKLFVVVGIEGWAPSVIQTAGQDLRNLRLASGGIVIELSKLITNDGNQVSGILKNLTLGGEGTVTFSMQGGTEK